MCDSPQTQLGAWLFAVTASDHFPLSQPSEMKLIAHGDTVLLSPCLVHRREIVLLLRQDCLGLET